MSPIILDVTSDFDPAINGPAPPSQQRTLLLAPPSLAAHEDRVSALFSTFDRAQTDLQMLDRLAAGLVTLPSATYDLVFVLTDTDGARRAEAAALLTGREIWARLVPALKTGGKLRSQDGSLKAGVPEAREAVLAGLVGDSEGFAKPEYTEEEVVPLRFGLKKKAAAPAPVPAPAPAVAASAGVGFVDFSDDLDLDAEDDDAIIDEDTLLTEEDLKRPIPQPPECQPQPGKKRRACKDCTCGLAERECLVLLTQMAFVLT